MIQPLEAPRTVAHIAPLPPTFPANTTGPNKPVVDGDSEPCSKAAWIANILHQASTAGFRTTPVFDTGQTRRYAKGQDYKAITDYSDATHIGLVLDRTVLVDYDANKPDATSIISIDGLAKKSGLAFMPEPFQIDEAGESIHWLFKLPDGVNLDDLRASNDGGWEKHVDIKCGNQVLHLKHHKLLLQGMPNKSDLPDAPHALIIALGKIKPAKTKLVQYSPPEETAELTAQARDVLNAIPADTTREIWRNTTWSIASLGLTCGLALLENWSATSPHYDDEASERLYQIYTGYDPERAGGLTYSYAKNLARARGWVDPASLVRPLVDTMEPIPFEGKGGDIENGQLFAARYRYAFLHLSQGGWLRFDLVAGWVRAERYEITAAAKSLVIELRVIAAECFRASGDDPTAKRMSNHVIRSQRTGSIKAMIEMAESEKGMTVSATEFDRDPMLLGVQNGVVDLGASELLPCTPDLLVSKKANVAYDPFADCPKFKTALKMWLPDPEMRAFVRRYFGLCLSGLITEQKLGFLYGLGANGKSVFIDIMTWLLGDYSLTIDSAMLMKQRFKDGQSPRPDIVALKGVRFAVGSELSDGQAFDEGELKRLTGGDELTGRALYDKASITFTPTHKLCLVGNHKPVITDTTHSMWRRPMLIGFDHVIPQDQQDKMLTAKLRQEGSGILNWLLEGLRDYQHGGLRIPKSVDDAVAQYRSDSDVLGIFLEEHYIADPKGKIEKIPCYKLYKQWAIDNGHGVLSSSTLTKRLAERGYMRDGSKKKIIGLTRVIPPFTSPIRKQGRLH
jgi:putative DNA primase/helicase